MPTKANEQSTKNLRNIFSDRIIVSCIMIILLVFGAFFLFFFPPLKPVSQTSEYHDFSLSSGFANGTILQQTFTSPINADSLGIYLNNYEIFLEDGYLDIIVTENSSEIFHQAIEVVQLSNNQFFYIDCALIEGTTYDLAITIHGLDDIDRVSFMVTNTKNGNSLVINNKKQESSLILSYANHVSDYFAIWYCVFGIGLIIIYIALFVRREFYEK